MPFTTTTANKIINKILRNTDFAHPEQLYVSLHTGDPGDTGANEVEGEGYERIPVTFAEPENKLSSNLENIEVENMPACTVTHMGLWDAKTGGSFWWGGQLVASKQLDAGDTVRFKIGDIDVELT